jgi:DNA-binding GntR family transcriptional regulator
MSLEVRADADSGLMRSINTSATVEEQVFQEIRKAILVGQLEPGSRLRLRELASELNVSSLPVRAALARLRAEGLVRHTSRSGSIVSPIEFEDFEELQALRLGIESLAARLGAERVDNQALTRMRKQLAVVDGLAVEQNLDRYLSAEFAFRLTCFRCSGRDRLVSDVSNYRLRAERYLRVAFSSPQGLIKSVDFQHKLLEACEKHDGDMAERETRRAIDWTKEALIARLLPVKTPLAQLGS